MRLRAEAVLAPLDLRPRHLVALQVLRQFGVSTQQALATTLAMDGTNMDGLLNESWQPKRGSNGRRSPEDRRRHVVELTEAADEQLAKAERAVGRSRQGPRVGLSRGVQPERPKPGRAGGRVEVRRGIAVQVLVGASGVRSAPDVPRAR